MQYLFPKLEKKFVLLATFIQMITNIIALIIIITGIFYSIYYYFEESDNNIKNFYDLRTILGETVAAALSFILCGQILKLYSVREYKQLIIIVSLILLKILLSYSVSYEISSAPVDIIKRIKFEIIVNKLLNLRNNK